MRRRKSETESPFVQLPRSLLESAALAALSLASRRILDRLTAEHLTHFGKANGQLMVSYVQLAAHSGVDKSDVSSALAELVDLGFVVIEHGQWSSSTKRFPNRYRLTFLPAEGAAPTHEWKRFEPSEGTGFAAWVAALKRAREIARAARRRGFRSEAEAKSVSTAVEAKLARIGRKAGKPGNEMTRAALVEHTARAELAPGKRKFRGASRAPMPEGEPHPRNAPDRGAKRTPDSKGASSALDSISGVEGGDAGSAVALCAGGAGSARISLTSQELDGSARLPAQEGDAASLSNGREELSPTPRLDLAR